MDDKRIIALFWSRDERAIEAAERAYGGLCRRVADNILSNVRDAEECVNDTWLRSWDSLRAYTFSSSSSFVPIPPNS